MTTREKQIDVLARTLLGEAKANNVDDAIAIACVVVNRIVLPNWPDDAEAVCFQPFQFSCWNTNDPNRARIMKAVSRPGSWFEKCIEIATAAVDRKLPDPTKRSTHYHTPAVKPAWSKKKKPVYETAGHRFFNDIDTPPPATATEALNQAKPLGKTDTMLTAKAAGMASVGITAVSQTVDALEPALPLAQTLATAAPWAIVAVLAIALAYVAWSRAQARKAGQV